MYFTMCASMFYSNDIETLKPFQRVDFTEIFTALQLFTELSEHTSDPVGVWISLTIRHVYAYATFRHKVCLLLAFFPNILFECCKDHCADFLWCNFHPSRFVALLWQTCTGQLSRHFIQIQLLIVGNSVDQSHYMRACTSLPEKH